jgi:hypothetical protein
MSNRMEWNIQNCIVCTELPHNIFISLIVLQISKYVICCNFSTKYDGKLGFSDFQF